MAAYFIWVGPRLAETTAGCYSVSEGPSPWELRNQAGASLGIWVPLSSPGSAEEPASPWAIVLEFPRETEPGVCMNVDMKRRIGSCDYGG